MSRKDKFGNAICEHNRQKYRCIECNPKAFCNHDRLIDRCKQCGGFLVLSKLMFSSAKTRAGKHNIPFSITVEDVLQLVGNGVCPVLGVSYDLTSKCSVDASATLDRFIPSLGYVKENCTVVSKLVNMIKTKATTEQVRKVADWMEQGRV